MRDETAGVVDTGGKCTVGVTMPAPMKLPVYLKLQIFRKFREKVEVAILEL
jgi:hypothetical protein